MSVTSQEKIKAEEMVKDFLPLAHDWEADNYIVAKKIAAKSVDNIIDALKTTTGHCELRSLDAQEVHSDFEFWKQVKQEIEKYEE